MPSSQPIKAPLFAYVTDAIRYAVPVVDTTASWRRSILRAPAGVRYRRQHWGAGRMWGSTLGTSLSPLRGGNSGWLVSVAFGAPALLVGHKAIGLRAG
jgi:hypothetical protein